MELGSFWDVVVDEETRETAWNATIEAARGLNLLESATLTSYNLASFMLPKRQFFVHK